MNQSQSSDLTRTTLAVLFIGILIAACFWVMRPFLTSLLWAAMIVIATWPNFLKLQTRLRGKRWLAVLVMTILLLLVLIIPICFAVLTILDRYRPDRGLVQIVVHGQNSAAARLD